MANQREKKWFPPRCPGHEVGPGTQPRTRIGACGGGGGQAGPQEHRRGGPGKEEGTRKAGWGMKQSVCGTETGPREKKLSMNKR